MNFIVQYVTVILIGVLLVTRPDWTGCSCVVNKNNLTGILQNLYSSWVDDRLQYIKSKQPAGWFDGYEQE